MATATRSKPRYRANLDGSLSPIVADLADPRLNADDAQAPTLKAAHDTSHDAASHTRRGLETWLPQGKSADADLLPELERMAHRARDLERNNPIAAGYLQTSRDNIVGATLNISPRPDTVLLGWDLERARAWSRTTRAQFRTWADSPECDAAASDTLIGLTNQMLTGALTNGDAIALPLWIDRPGNGWRSKLLVIESDRLDTPPQLGHRADIRKGVEIDDNGAPVAYHINRHHPRDYQQYGQSAIDDFIRIPAFTPWGRRRVIHLRDKTRAGANRGRPIFAAVTKELFQTGQYADAELTAALVQSLVAAFMESDLPPDQVFELFNSQENPEGYWAESLKRVSPQLKSGAIINLPLGAKPQFLAPSRPNSAFDAFLLAVERHIGTGTHLPRELLTKDFSRSNYSSARAALLEAWRYFHSRRRWLIDAWFTPIYALWMEEAVDLGRVEADRYYSLQHCFTRARWTFAGRGWVDPTKEATAAQIRMDIGVSTLEQECAEQGLDWEDVLEQRAYEQQRTRDLGLTPADTASLIAADQRERTTEQPAEQGRATA
ncbi:MAG: phage portal protein [Lamprobacter sp.]|uniref:phage portal protein n=1 Tax=Lamprobacter sp. TaxID=3100796 RepID=UPI002B258C5B|nr:phage portal protein [Lamprobacter sp.]MEA3641289.1 phage portal protein [Lamprobacter sp.]